jgi:hypothetical protein
MSLARMCVGQPLPDPRGGDDDEEEEEEEE